MDIEAPRRTATRTTPAVELAITADLDMAAIPQADEILDHIAALHPSHVVIDMAACGFIDAMGIRWLLRANRQLRDVGAQLTVRSPTRGTRRLLHLTRADEVLRIVPAIDATDRSGGPLASR